MSLQDAKLILTPNGYKAGKVYAVKPTDGSGDATVIRNTTKTRVNSSGLIESNAVNVLAPDYLNGACPALNVEGQATNLFTFSEDFTQGVWDKNNANVVQGTGSPAVVTANFATAPNGTLTADRLQLNLNGGTTSGDRSGLTRSLSLSGNSTQSVYIKSNSGDVSILFQATGGTSVSKNVNVTNQYQRVVLPSFNNNEYRIFLIGGLTSLDADLSIWGAQQEAGTEATSYIPATTAAVTRSADTVTVPIPAGTTEIIEKYEDGTSNTITTIPASPYTVPTGKRYEYILMR